MKKQIRMIAVAAVAVAAFACSEDSSGNDTGRFIAVSPTITRAAELDFEAGDRIGLTVVKNGAEAPYAANAEMTYDGRLFIGRELLWYYEINDEATLRAYYPYAAEAEPSTFAVRSDQRGDGYTLSDFMTSVRTGVRPSSDAVDMVFAHRLSKLNIAVANDSVAEVVEIVVSGAVLSADVDIASQSVVAGDGAVGDITAHEVSAGAAYCAVIVPQTAALTVTALLSDGSQRRCTMRPAEFAGGRQYTA
ncbi:MAG: fimbrillin family protein, partial [Alistipes sp.]|nr:fimbrillin family protein [Alistipes sp.]